MSHEIDRWLGRHLMGLRRRRGMTHSDIAVLIDRTPADIEAFEQGTTRMTAACIVQLTRKLDLSLPMFFLDIEPQSTEPPERAAPLRPAFEPNVAEGLRLIKMFHSIKDPAKRAAVLDFVSSIAKTIH